MIDSRTIPIRFSNLKRMADSPRHYQWAINHPFEASRTMRIGTIAHALILGESTPLAVYDGTRRGKEWDAFKAAHEGREIVSPAEYDAARPIAEAVRNDADATRVLDGVHEEHIAWEYCGRAASSRPDVRGATFVTDLKTTRSAHPGRFGRDAYWRGYHAQLAFYQMACGLPARSPCYIVAVENVAPYCVTVFRADQAAIDAGHMQCRAWFERLLVCEASDHWPGYASGIQSFGLPEQDTLDLTFGDEEEAS